MAKRTLADAEADIKALKAAHKKEIKKLNESFTTEMEKFAESQNKKLDKKVITETELVKNLKKQIQVLQKNPATNPDELIANAVKPLQEKITTLEKELNDERNKIREISPEERAIIEAEVLSALATEIEKEKAQEKTIPQFTPAQDIRIKGGIFTLLNNPQGFLGAWSEQMKDINCNLFKAQNIPFHVAEIPEESRKGNEFYLVYKGLTTIQTQNVVLNDNSNG